MPGPFLIQGISYWSDLSLRSGDDLRTPTFEPSSASEPATLGPPGGCEIASTISPVDAKRYVTLGDDPREPRFLVDDRERTDVFLLHQPRRVTNRCLRRHSARPLRHYFVDLRSHVCPPSETCLLPFRFPPSP